MVQFVAYSLWGFWLGWLSCRTFGYVGYSFTAYDFASLVGVLLFLFVAGPLGLFLPRISAIMALIAVAFMLSRLVGFVLFDFGNLFPSLLAIPIVGWPSVPALYCLWKTRAQKWLTVPPWKSPALRIILAIIPSAVFVTAFDIYEWHIGL
jgi:hypothetical protein